MDKAEKLLIFMVAFLVGIFLGEFFLSGEFVKMASVFLVIMVVGKHYWKEFLIIFCGILLGGLRLWGSLDLDYKHISNIEGFVEFRGCIVGEVDVRNDKVKYVFDSDEFEGRVLVIGNRYPRYFYGECFKVAGFQQKPEIFEGFAYDKYLARYDLYSVIYRATFEPVTENNGGMIVFDILYRVKGIFEDQLEKIYAEPHGSFMAGLILGSRRGIPDRLMEDFNTTGLTHIIAISGYNITLIIVIVSAIFGFLERKRQIIASVIFIVLFVILVGASAAVVRAAVMGVISLLALWYGRQNFVTNTLIIAAFVMNLWNPKILVYDIGFQLSFLATCGLVYVSPLIEKYFEWVPKVVGIRESVLMTMSAQIFALPVIVYNFGRLSLISPVANLFVLPFIPLAMLFGFLSVICSFVWEFLGVFVGFVGYLILELVILIVKIFANFEFASIEINWFSWWMLILYYLMIWRWIWAKN